MSAHPNNDRPTSGRTAARRGGRAAAAGAVTVLTLLGVTACGPDDTPNPPPSSAPAPSSAVPSAKGGLPAGLPSLADLKKWKAGDWDNWAKQHVITPAAKGFWDFQKMLQAKPAAPVAPTQPPTDPGAGSNDPLPSAIPATAVPHPYSVKNAVDGKIFFDKSDGKHYVCSGTVVSDPAHPGKSNLVWTAGHCVDGGKDGSPARNVTFIPEFNSTGAVSKGKTSTPDKFAPLGMWPGLSAISSPQWTSEGTESGGPASQYDFGIIKVGNPDGGTKSLEETVGGSVPVLFNAPRDQLSLSAIGYPAAPPFDGAEMEQCNGGKPSKLSFDSTRPAMYTIGCTMTGGSSGGGWFAVYNGKAYLVSNTSIGPADNPAWLAGPYLDDVASSAFDYISKKG
ncbi:V8-like Glu-specific endopeptidase [Kitasatospora sp. MAA4]|uniref:trypsin-like serine peptidase n=1 Tax=Kitasatospora sp. MAA4 TaxID=3035093 RepID=UPI002476042A|nr:hypothetical protein [Kitasatospora sp. MAA4]MDH6136090.1 V8-like Glu-specific endopeptidase [Kitasatospora sp. MAA4]